MHPTLFPPSGHLVDGLGEALGLMAGVAKQAAATHAIEAGGGINSEIGANGIRLWTDPPPQLACFEITTCWKKTNKVPLRGPSHGCFWTCKAKLVTYWSGPGLETFYKKSATHDYWRIFYPAGPPQGKQARGTEEVPSAMAAASGQTDAAPASIGSGSAAVSNASAASGSTAPGPTPPGGHPPSACEVKKGCQITFYPRFGRGQWVWCIFDYVAGIWRLLDGFDNMIRFRLLEPLTSCTSAMAEVVGFKCKEKCGGSSSSSSGQAGSQTSGSGQSGASGTNHPSGSATSGCGGGSRHSTHKPPSSHPAPTPSSGQSPSAAPSSAPASSGGSASSSASGSRCPSDSIVLGKIRLFDKLGVVNLQFPPTTSSVPKAPPGTMGWARWNPDAERFEVVAYAKCRTCASSSNSSSSRSQASSKSSKPSPSTPSQSAQSSASKSESSHSRPSSSSQPSSSSAPSSRSRSSQSQSSTSKSTAIVPASWSSTGYTALFIAEEPCVRFNDVAVVYLSTRVSYVPVDRKYLEVCEPKTMEVWASSREPVPIGVSIDGDCVRIELPQKPLALLRVALRLSAIRNGFGDKILWRFPERTAEQFEANEEFIKKSYPGGTISQ